jgi:hypothetical protein
MSCSIRCGPKWSAVLLDWPALASGGAFPYTTILNLLFIEIGHSTRSKKSRCLVEPIWIPRLIGVIASRYPEHHPSARSCQQNSVLV